MPLIIAFALALMPTCANKFCDVVMLLTLVALQRMKMFASLQTNITSESTMNFLMPPVTRTVSRVNLFA